MTRPLADDDPRGGSESPSVERVMERAVIHARDESVPRPREAVDLSLPLAGPESPSRLAPHPSNKSALVEPFRDSVSGSDRLESDSSPLLDRTPEEPHPPFVLEVEFALSDRGGSDSPVREGREQDPQAGELVCARDGFGGREGGSDQERAGGGGGRLGGRATAAAAVVSEWCRRGQVQG